MVKKIYNKVQTSNREKSPNALSNLLPQREEIRKQESKSHNPRGLGLYSHNYFVLAIFHIMNFHP